ncbi:MAG: iron(III) transport system ATP-binding protein [Methanobacteriota archaeon]|jgi:iron(III) transport system ATP-binding protein|uniref:Molybdate/tungstate import ATP-binding protein WtpC n=1 Tax=Halorutilus salinus TaxID=2487751 RepID=A0A9Q4C407_9EURY|nr:ABC transporter ATP-binding protein [Halorutilus salinus]MCX2819033.1 ABC transporter ATP-binding protein [Halorutilus salinus]
MSKTAARQNVLELDGVTKRYGEESAVEELSVRVRDGEFLTLLGPSGCGKTTTLRLVAGLETPDEGEVRIAGTSVAGGGRTVKPENRDVGLVFQEFALFPHMSVEENVAFGLEDGDDDRVDGMLELVGLEEHRAKKPDQLSGGQRQRVALARSLAPEPDVLLLDEPFSNLDVGLRVRMREEVRRITKEAGVTTVSVTHDQEEALSISDRVGVMNDGRLEQVGDPEKVFQTPESRFVADFLGHASFVPGTVTDEGVETPLGTVGTANIEGLTSEYEGAEVDILVRPDDAKALAPDGDGDGRIIHRTYDGPSFTYRVELEGGDTVHCMHNHTESFEVGDEVRVRLELDHPLAWYPSEK